MRPSWDDYFNALASMISTRSTCRRQQHGAIIVRDKQLLSTGFNGAPSGITSCDELGRCLREEKGAKPGEHYEWCIALHAEQNAIIQAAKHGTTVAGASIYVTGAPCVMCARAIINAGVVEVVFVAGERYNAEEAVGLLTQAGVRVRIL